MGHSPKTLSREPDHTSASLCFRQRVKSEWLLLNQSVKSIGVMPNKIPLPNFSASQRVPKAKRRAGAFSIGYVLACNAHIRKYSLVPLEQRSFVSRKCSMSLAQQTIRETISSTITTL
jgi:hypothetical protein